jgi:hypothetical protein
MYSLEQFQNKEKLVEGELIRKMGEKDKMKAKADRERVLFY